MTPFISLKKQGFTILRMITLEETIQNLTGLLETESSIAIEWFQNNKMMVNPGKFQAIIIDKKKNAILRKL